MTDLRDPTPAGNAAVSPRNGTAGGAAAPDPSDPLHNLYRMSLTAGLGSGDYVAINNTSIAALLLGLASVLSLLYPIMLIAALAAVVCGALALVQIRSSNGTQSGRAFAGLGILLGLALGGAAVGRMVIARVEKGQDEQAIGQVVQRMNELVVGGQHAEAYRTLFTDRFKGEFSEAEFLRTWETFTPVMGRVKSVGWGNRADLEAVRATNEKRGIIVGEIVFEKAPTQQPVTLVKPAGGEWKIDSIAQLFEKAKPRQSGDQPVMPDPTMPLGPEFMPQQSPEIQPLPEIPGLRK